MEGIAFDWGKRIVENLVNNALAESRYICCFTCIVEDFEKEKETLKAKRTTVEQYVKLANRRAEDIRRDVVVWQEQADKLIEEDTKTKEQTCLFGWCPNCKWRYNRGKELTNKALEMKRLMQSNFESVGITPNLPDVEYHSSHDYIAFKSRELKYKELSDALIDYSSYIIGLQGMGGTGKTTLAKELGKELKQSKQFDLVIDTTVSYTSDIKKIQDDIAAPLGLDLKNYNESERPRILWSRLTSGEKILLILDDMWGHVNLEEIGIPDSDSHKGCRILLTTRNLWVCKSQGCEKIIQLELLSEEDAWILFKKHAGISDSSSKRLVDKGRKIAKECKGLPVAIAAIGSSLKGQQHQEEWNAALKSLLKFVPMHGVDENMAPIYKCLRYSYDNMNNESAKRLFLLCSMFKEDEELSIEILTRFGIGAGLFGEIDEKYDDARSQVVVAKNKLIDSCLLLKGGEGRVKMHDLVREVALLIANKEIQVVNVSNKNQKSLIEREKNIKYLLCDGKCMDVFSCKFDGSKLKILTIYMDDKGEDSMEVPNSFFENMTGLQVLCLSNKSLLRETLSLSLSIQSLMNIRSLVLERFKLGDISFLGNLKSLETLDLVRCFIDELASEIEKLEKLRLLKLDRCEIRRNGSFEVIERCLSLEELYITVDPISKVDSAAIYQIRNIPILQRYCLTNRYVFEKNDSMLKCVHFSEINALFSETATFKYLVQTAEILDLRGIEGRWKNLIPEIVPIDKGMKDLSHLDLTSFSKLQCLIDTRLVYSQEQIVFPKLVVLTLKNMDDLRELCNGPIPFHLLKSLERLFVFNCHLLQSILFKGKLNLCNVKTMRLSNCPRLESLFQLSTSQSLVLLEELEIHDCEQLKHIITEEEIIDGMNDNKSGGSMFPNLKTLDIMECPELEVILPFISDQDLPLLEAINIYDCDELKYIFGQYQHQHESQGLVKDVVLHSLKEMELSGLPNFIDIFPECHHPMCSSVKKIYSRNGSKAQKQLNPIKGSITPWMHICCYAHKYRHKLRNATSTKSSLVSKDQSQDDSVSSVLDSNTLQLWRSAQCLSKQSQILRNIKELVLQYLSKIEFIFSLSIAPTMLVETLRIRHCDELKFIIIDIGDDRGGNDWSIVFPKLKELYVKGCEKLEYIFGNYPDNHKNQNEIHFHLPVLECLKFRFLPNLIGMCLENYHPRVSSLTVFELNECPNFTIKSIGDLTVHSDPSQLDGNLIKDLSEHMKHFSTLGDLQVHNSKAENIFCFSEIIVQPINLGLHSIQLSNLSQMTYLFVGPENSFTLQNLTKLNIVRCEKLEIIFPASVSRCLPHLHDLIIDECKELKQIIEEDVGNSKMSNYLTLRTCFPKLAVLVVKKCNKLKCIFPISKFRELPMLEILMIKEALELKEVFRCKKGDHKVELPNLKMVLLVELPSLNQDIQFHAIEHSLVQNCPKFALTSTLTMDSLKLAVDEVFGMDWFIKIMLQNMIRELEDSGTQYANNENLVVNNSSIEPEVLAASKHELTSSQVNENQSIQADQDEYMQQGNDIKSNEFISVETKGKPTLEVEHDFVEKVNALEIPITTISPTNLANAKTSPLDITPQKTYSYEFLDEQPMGEHSSMKERQPLGKTEIIFEVPQGNNGMQPPNYYLKDRENQSTQGDSMSGKNTTATPLMKSETRNRALGTLVSPLQKGIKRNVEEGTTSANFKSITSSTRSELVSSSLGQSVASKEETYRHEHGDGQMTIPSILGVTTEPPYAQETSETVVALTNCHDPVSLNGDASMKVSSIVEELFLNNDGIGVSDSKPFPSIPSHVVSKSLSMPFDGSPSQNMDDVSFASLVKSELEQLVSNKYLASENMTLLTEFLAKHPSLRLKDNALSNKYKGYAYTCLAELLKFLQIHSVLDVLESKHSNFMELMQDMRSFSFDKNWLDGVERRALFPSLKASEDALQKLLDSKRILTQHVKDLKHQVASSEAVLESIIQQEAQVLEARASLSAPLGY
ncbi:uncharacterized protein LOC113851230 [Abrus precatorius]|uniref:Uncharacterized protein LOC113851230 n=1 Tax=Abrus precatorius TaxID=3816 RepID=A0A8B8K390_ABRPR|nr:uncharacterized protein LOC113851230 [Abrus precatorius]